VIPLVEFKANISDPKDGKSYHTVVSGHHANSLIGKKIGDQIDGIFLGLPGYKLLITGGSDKDGFPMRRDMPGAKRTRILVSRGFGFRAPRKGMRRRKTMRGSAISPDTVQINFRVTSHGAKPIADILKPAEKKEGA
jgi:small subunit ribosomal protein S6e